ncbi:hypothetical protein Hanom_Chr09g00867371 [Helianthus anomalus]
MHHVVAFIAKRQGSTCTNWPLSYRVLCVLCPRFDAKLPLSRGSHWKQTLYSYG